MGFNLRRSPLDSKEFRQAVATLIDKEFVAGTVLPGAAIPVYSMVPEGNRSWHNPDVATFSKGLNRSQRIAGALELLAAAGFTWEEQRRVSADGRFVEIKGKRFAMPNGEPVPELEILAPSAGYDPLRSTFAPWVERWLNDFGIPASVRFTSFVHKVAGQQDFDLFILGWSLALFPDYLEIFFHSRRSMPGDLNVGGYSDADFDKLAKELLGETDLEAAREKVFVMQEFLAEELPFVPLYNPPIIETNRSDRVEFPFTEMSGGLQNIDGSPSELLAVMFE